MAADQNRVPTVFVFLPAAMPMGSFAITPQPGRRNKVYGKRGTQGEEVAGYDERVLTPIGRPPLQERHGAQVPFPNLRLQLLSKVPCKVPF